ncbi:neurofilament medium polypeptide-like protein, partial [Lasius niger]
MIMAQLRRMEERQISIENKTDENSKIIKRLMRESAVRRPVKPQGISFRTVDDFLAFEEVDEEIYNDL